jgi:hypothetical protein
MDVNEQIQNLIEVRDALSEKTFREAAALVYTTYFIKKMIEEKERFNRSKLLRQVNESLRTLDCKEVTYSFFRKPIK